MKTLKSILVWSTFALLLTLSGCTYSAYHHLQSGIEKVNSEDYEEALAEFDRAIAIDPELAEAYIWRGRIKRYPFEDIEGSFDDINIALDINPQYAEAYNSRCLTHNALRDWQAMADDATRAIEILPEYSAAIINRAIANQEMGNIDLAIEDYNLALQINSEDKDALDSYFHRGTLYFHQHDHENALHDFNACYDLTKVIWVDYPHISNILWYRSVLNFIQRNFEESAEGFASYYEAEGNRSPYIIFPWYVAKARLGSIDTSILNLYSEEAENQDWPFPISEMLTDQITFEECIALSVNPDSTIQQGNLCEAYYYIAEKCLIDGEPERASDYLELCLETGVETFVEHMAASKELGDNRSR